MFWLYSFHVNPLLSSSGRQRENSGSTSTTSTLSPSRLDNDINFSPNWSHRDIRDPVSVTRPNRWPTWHWHWWELETYILCFVMIGVDLCPPVVINAGLPAVIALLERVVNRKGQIQSLRNKEWKVRIYNEWRLFSPPNTCPGTVWCSSGARIHCFFHRNPQSANLRRSSSRYGDIQAWDKQRVRDMRSCSLWCQYTLIENSARRLLGWGTSRMPPIRGAVSVDRKE